MNIRPLNNNVLVRINDDAEKSPSGIVMPDSMKERPQTATVIAKGPGSRDINGIQWAIDVKIGDTIIISKYGGRELKVGNEKLYLVGEQEILGVLEDRKEGRIFPEKPIMEEEDNK